MTTEGIVNLPKVRYD